ncbi:Uncharacterised protein [Bordetella pertussis]|nr:Uncharacterised protein [Bordetella pertussis]
MRDLQVPDRIGAGAYRCHQAQGAPAPDAGRLRARLPHGVPDVRQRRHQGVVAETQARLRERACCTSTTQ